MLEKLKNALNYILSAAVVILGYIAFNRNRKLQQKESELAREKSTTEIKLNDQAREAAKSNADALVAEYERLRRERK